VTSPSSDLTGKKRLEIEIGSKKFLEKRRPMYGVNASRGPSGVDGLLYTSGHKEAKRGAGLHSGYLVVHGFGETYNAGAYYKQYQRKLI